MFFLLVYKEPILFFFLLRTSLKNFIFNIKYLIFVYLVFVIYIQYKIYLSGI